MRLDNAFHNKPALFSSAWQVLVCSGVFSMSLMKLKALYWNCTLGLSMLCALIATWGTSSGVKPTTIGFVGKVNGHTACKSVQHKDKNCEKEPSASPEWAWVLGELLCRAWVSYPAQIRHKFTLHDLLPGVLHQWEWGTGGDRKGMEMDLVDPICSPRRQGDFS